MVARRPVCRLVHAANRAAMNSENDCGERDVAAKPERRATGFEPQCPRAFWYASMYLDMQSSIVW